MDHTTAEHMGTPFGDYRLLAPLGEGGMAQVFLAVKQGPMGFRKELAIKRIRTDVTRNNDMLMRSLVNEARLGGQLKHPNVVDTYEFGVVDGQFYIAMEYVHGLTLRELLDAVFTRRIKLPVSAVLDLACQICDGLAYAHTLAGRDGVPLGLVHRDLKPGNIIVSMAGQTKIMDFGIARSSAALFHTTGETTTKGTLAHMSPEQVQDPRNVDHRTDVFALGTVIFETLTGERLLNALEASSLIYMLVSGNFRSRLESLERICPDVVEVVGRCVEVEREHRYANAEEVGRDLRRVRSTCSSELGCRELMSLVAAAQRGREALDEQAIRVMGPQGRPVDGTEEWLPFVDAIRQLPLTTYDPEAEALRFGASTEGGPDDANTCHPDAFPDTPRRDDSSLVDLSPPPSTQDTVVVAARGRRTWTIWVGVAALALLVGGGGWLAGMQGRQDPTPGVDPPSQTPTPTPTPTPTLTPTPTPTPTTSTPTPTPTSTTTPTAVVPPVDPPPPPPKQTPPRRPSASAEPVPVTINSDPWSMWTLAGPDTLSLSGDATPFERPLAPGRYVLTLNNPLMGKIKALPFQVQGGEEEITLCWSFSKDGPC